MDHLCRLVLLPYYYFGSILRYSFLYSDSICSYRNRGSLEENKDHRCLTRTLILYLILFPGLGLGQVLDQVQLLMILADRP